MGITMHRTIRIAALGGLAAAAAVTSTAFTPPALAGDIAGPPAQIVAHAWTGIYAGVHGGWGWGTTDVRDPQLIGVFNPTVLKYDGPLAGAQLGANWQVNNVVLGAEIDGSWAFVRNPTIVASGTNSGIGYSGLATGTARVGYAMNQWLLYAKGGAAWADIGVSTRISPLPTNYDRSLFGAVGGVGLEVAFLRNVSAKVEYNLIYLPTDKLVYTAPDTTSSLDHLVQVVKFGINVRLAGDAGPTR